MYQKTAMEIEQKQERNPTWYAELDIAKYSNSVRKFKSKRQNDDRKF